MPRQTKKTKKRAQSTVTEARLYIVATLNNTIVTATDQEGSTLFWSSTGAAGFKGSRKATPYASTVAIEKVIDKMKQAGISQLKVFLKGPGAGRDTALRVLRAAPFRIVQLADITPLPHNGTRQRKQRRV